MSAYYRDGWFDAATGQPLSNAELTAMRNAFLTQVATELAGLVEELGEPEQFITWPASSVNRWADRFLDKIREVAIRAYAGITGGVIAGIPAKGWETIADVLDRQTPFAARFVQEVRGGGLSREQIAARSELYTSAATATWERGKADQIGLELPGYPAEACEGGGRCRCAWDIEETETEIRCYWRAAGDENTCDPCADNARRWNPHKVVKS